MVDDAKRGIGVAMESGKYRSLRRGIIIGLLLVLPFWAGIVWWLWF